jgi:hypothetical protein
MCDFCECLIVKTKTGGFVAPLIFIYIYAAAFCFSFAGIPYIINAEIWPQRLRPYCLSYGVFVHWLMNLIIGKSTPVSSGFTTSLYLGGGNH